MRHLAGPTVAALLGVVVLFPPSPARLPEATAQPVAAALPYDLALVPADALGFLHIRAAELWKHDLLAPFRETFEKAGPKVLAALNEQLVPRPSSLDRVTVFVLANPEDPRAEPVPFVVVRFREPQDPEAIVKVHLPGAEKDTIDGHTVYAAGPIGLTFPDKQHLVLGIAPTLPWLLNRDRPKTGPLAAALKLAAAGKPVVLSVAVTRLPLFTDEERETMPADLRPLLKTQYLTAYVELGRELTIQVQAGYEDAAAARAARKALRALAEQLRPALREARDQFERQLLDRKGPRPLEEWPEIIGLALAIGAANRFDELLTDPEKLVKQDGNLLTASLSVPVEGFTTFVPTAATLAGFLLPAVQKVREAATRTKSLNNLKQLTLAIHSYHDAYGHLPHDIVDKNGKPLLSWRVQILPFLDQEALYRQFKLDEPWDSPNNLRASQQTVDVFLSPRAPAPARPGLTHYQVFVGPGALFEPGKRIRFTDVTDGLSNTLLLVETAEAVEWAKPGGLPFDPNRPLPRLTSISGDGMLALALADGAVRTLNLSVGEKRLKALITRNGGEPIDWDR